MNLTKSLFARSWQPVNLDFCLTVEEEDNETNPNKIQTEFYLIFHMQHSRNMKIYWIYSSESARKEERKRLEQLMK